MPRRGRKTINVDRARELRAEGLSWREVGIVLADEEGRRVAYAAPSVREVCQPSPGRLAKMLARSCRAARD